MSISDEELIEYLLQEGDSHLIQRVEDALEVDPQLVQRLHALRAALGLLDSLKSVVEPPSDLLDRTLDLIAESPTPKQLEPTVRLRPTEVHSVPRSRRSVWDSAFLTASVAALACLMLPLMLQGRSISRQHQCAHNLKVVGEGLTQLAILDPEHRFPAVPLNGIESFAGRFVLKLQDKGLLDSPAYLRCVSVPGAEGEEPRIVCVPTTSMFLSADPVQQDLWRKQLGGNYAANFGVIEDGRIVGSKLQGRTHFAVLADAPSLQGASDVFEAHEGRGINIYYEDGHVAFSRLPRGTPIATRSPEESAVPATHIRQAVTSPAAWSAAYDYPFRNLAGQQAYGLHQNDAALGPSFSAPQLESTR